MTIKASSPTPVSQKAFNDIHGQRVQETTQLDPVVDIVLKRNHYTLEFNNWAVKQILLETGVNMISSGFTREHMENPNVIGPILLWGLKTQHPELTQDEVDKMFTLRHYAYIIDRLSEAIDLFLPDMSDYQVERPVTEANPGDPTSPPIPVGSGIGRLVAV